MEQLSELSLDLARACEDNGLPKGGSKGAQIERLRNLFAKRKEFALVRR